MNRELLRGLNYFIGRASKATYAGGGGKVEKPWRKGFNELEFAEGDWYYRDSYAGFLRSWGQEVVWYKGAPFWTCLYGGGMNENHMDNTFARQTFSFLKKVLSSGEKENAFQPRGPRDFKEGDYQYHCEFAGSIEKFKGSETIEYAGKVVFTHDFTGGLVIDQQQGA